MRKNIRIDPLSISSSFGFPSPLLSAFHLLLGFVSIQIGEIDGTRLRERWMGPGFEKDRWDPAGGFEPSFSRKRKQKM
jgi:hypothetical protein